MQERVILKISTRKAPRQGSRIGSVPLLKLKRLALCKHTYWKLEEHEKGDFLILTSY
jgi:hypothetical protein